MGHVGSCLYVALYDLPIQFPDNYFVPTHKIHRIGSRGVLSPNLTESCDSLRGPAEEQEEVSSSEDRALSPYRAAVGQST